ncbi:MAG: nucleoside-diphosphate kinase [Candidatus Eisenbacteria bacterium]
MMVSRTLLMVKPDATERNLTGRILGRLEGAGFHVRGIRALRLRKEEAESFYAVHRERPFYGELVEYMISGVVVPVVLEMENAVPALRDFIGATNPAKAREGSIRRDFGVDIQRNSVHASDSPENATREIGFFFAERELV